MPRKILSASIPAPIRYGFTRSNFTGEFCPICGKNKLTSIHLHPICSHCRKRYDITHKLLKAIKPYRILIFQETIDWKQLPPTLSGTIDQISWEGKYIDGKWQVEHDEKDLILTQLLEQYLGAITKADNPKAMKSAKYRRYGFIAACGGVIVTGAYLLSKAQERQNRELQEAEETEKHFDTPD